MCDMDQNGIMVSICCLVYNHEKYLRECLENLVRQKTNFKFEVLIHDDASTDASPEIIREYEKKYPDIIKPIYQRENQYSKSVKISFEYQYPRAKGKYLAFCEGDDFWCDENKLQIQFDMMEQNPEHSLCVHPSYLVNPNGERIGIIEMGGESRIISIQNFLEEKYFSNNKCFQTSSFFVKKECIDRLLEIKPNFFMNASVGDFPLVLFLATEGDIYYYNHVMSCYRVGHEGAWSAGMKNNPSKWISHNLNMISMFNDYNIYTSKAYEPLLKDIIDLSEYRNCCTSNDYRGALKHRRSFKYEPRNRKIYLLLMAYAPWSVKVIQKIRRMF